MRAVTLPIIIMLIGCLNPAHAEQPIFDEMPRWSGGWGVQMLQEFRLRNRRFHEGASTSAESSEQIHLTHVQGVYTWHKSIRVTAKIPIVLHANQRIENADGTVIEAEEKGVGDPTFALPLKHYFNLDGRSGSWTLAPQIRVPLGKADGYEVYSRQWATGASLGYETETYRYHLGLGLSGWYVSGQEPNTLGLNASLGMNLDFGTWSGHLKLKQYLRVTVDEHITYALGPTLYARVTDLIHVQIQTKHDLLTKRLGQTAMEAHSFRVGIGFVY